MAITRQGHDLDQRIDRARLHHLVDPGQAGLVQARQETVIIGQRQTDRHVFADRPFLAQQDRVGDRPAPFGEAGHHIGLLGSRIDRCAGGNRKKDCQDGQGIEARSFHTLALPYPPGVYKFDV